MGHNVTMANFNQARSQGQQTIKQETQLMQTKARDAFRDQSRSPIMTQFDMLDMVSYYCAIVTVSAQGYALSSVFVVARCLYVCLSVCSSVRLSRWWVVPRREKTDIIKLLVRPRSPIILVFLSPSADAQFQGTPFSGGVKYAGWEKFAIFD